ncbi:PEP-CTERM sorting domain-containing protein [uncultured Desulfobulbus sp.]|uniref:PEP-CTERM sorting domain-containing protein n=1 Tax=uncultured Desulfobulbus sp. TaxID=239745 RepID=UPI0029C7B366|nr:PEP-CTERM sorting domain-containing protein [uncultured Desulfobulbus sp.]
MKFFLILFHFPTVNFKSYILSVFWILVLTSPSLAVPLRYHIDATLLDNNATDVGSVFGSFVSDTAPETGNGAVWDVDIIVSTTNGTPGFTFLSGEIQSFNGRGQSETPTTIFVFNYPSQNFESPDSKAMKIITNYPIWHPGFYPIYPEFYNSNDSLIFTSFYAPYVSPDTYLYMSGELTVRPVQSNAPVPEPTTTLLFGTGLAGLAAVGRRRRN